MQKLTGFICCSLLAISASADSTVPLYAVDASGTTSKLGEIAIAETPYGLVFTPSLQGLSPGIHGFHVHQNPDCGPLEKDGKVIPGGAAGSHYDPAGSNRHGTPWGDGHLGDLPALYVDADGRSTQPVLAPRLKKLGELDGRSLMIHAGGDNHADHPAPLGGGGSRIACGII